jgi:hypothetical protein
MLHEGLLEGIVGLSGTPKLGDDIRGCSKQDTPHTSGSTHVDKAVTVRLHDGVKLLGREVKMVADGRDNNRIKSCSRLYRTRPSRQRQLLSEFLQSHIPAGEEWHNEGLVQARKQFVRKEPADPPGAEANHKEMRNNGWYIRDHGPQREKVSAAML